VKDSQWNMKPDQAKALMLAKRQLAELAFYESNNRKPMNTFLRSCLDERIIKIMKVYTRTSRKSSKMKDWGALKY